MTVERVQARVFGEVAQEYDRIRPGYPDQLFDDVLAYAALGERPALEVGAGTGKATLAFARRGIAVTAIEPDEAMADMLRLRLAGQTLAGQALAGQANVAVTVSTFEDYAPSESFGLLFSAQAWHWADPQTRWRRAAEVLAPGGALALFWNIERLADAEVVEAIVRAHRDHATGIVVETQPVDGLHGVWPHTDLVAQPEFGELSERVYRWQRILSRADYLACLATHSSYRMLEDELREQVLQTLGEVLGDEVTIDVATVPYLARRRRF